MKKLALTLAILMTFSSVAFGALTAEEEATVTLLHNNKQKLIDIVQRVQTLSDIADGVTDETIPVEIARLRARITDVTRDRDIETNDIKSTAIGNANTVTASYETVIVSLNNDISALESSL